MQAVHNYQHTAELLQMKSRLLCSSGRRSGTVLDQETDDIYGISFPSKAQSEVGVFTDGFLRIMAVNEDCLILSEPTIAILSALVLFTESCVIVSTSGNPWNRI